MFEDDNMEDLREEHLDELFGNSSRLDGEKWVEMMSDEDHDWLFVVEKLRSKVMDKAGVSKRH